MELNERKQKILTAMIEAYIHTGEPVGSKLLAERLGHAVSSATIRTEMAELAAMGYLEQPHTSAGRIPTAPAFRLYIDKLMAREPLGRDTQEDIDQLLESAAHDPERLIEDASNALAAVTGCAAVSTTPSERGASVRRLELMRISGRAAALVLMTSSGLIRNRVCRFDRPVGDGLLERTIRFLSDTFTGEELSDITLPRIQGLMPSLGVDALACAPLLSGLLELAQESAEAEILLAGQLNLLQHPDYELDKARSLLGFLSRREQLATMLTAYSGGLRVVLGSESPRPELDGSSIILTRYRIGNGGGAIGVIGPLRMDYAATIPRIEYLAQSLGRMLSDLMES